MTKRRNRGAPAKGRGALGKGRRSEKGYKSRPVRAVAKPKRNDPCPCGSGGKYKKCCGITKVKPVPLPVPYETFQAEYTPEQKQAEVDFILRWGFIPNLTQLQMFMENDVAGLTTMVTVGLGGIESNAPYVYAVKKLSRLVTPKNQSLVGDEVDAEWKAALAEYHDRDISGDTGEAAEGSAEGAVRPDGEAAASPAEPDA